MTIAEGLAGYYWLTQVLASSGEGGVYHFPVVVAGAALAAGLAVERAVEMRYYRDRKINPFRAATFAAIEVVVWTQWANIVLAGLWSRTGIGPATVVLAALMTVQHVAEAVETRHSATLVRHAATALVESIAVTGAWVLLLEGYPLGAAVTLTLGLFVEHGYQLSKSY